MGNHIKKLGVRLLRGGQGQRESAESRRLPCIPSCLR
jgi:hypothetical protein